MFGVTATALTLTARVSPEELQRLSFGAWDGGVRVVEPFSWTTPGADLPALAALEERLTGILPAGSHVGLDIDIIEVDLEGPGGAVTSAPGRVLDLSAPQTAPMLRLDEGQPVPRAGTMVLTTALAEILGVGVDDPILVGSSRRRITVSALVSRRDNLSAQGVYLPVASVWAGDLAAAVDARSLGSPRWLLDAPGDVTPSLVMALEEAGFSYQDASATVADAAANPSGANLLWLSLAAGLLAEVGLLVAAAFAVITRQERRHQGILAALAVPTQVRTGSAIAHGAIIGTAGAGLGFVGGQGAALALAPWLSRRAQADWGPVEVPWVSVGLLGFLAVAIAVIAAWWPARRMLRRSPTELLNDAPEPIRRRSSSVRRAVIACWCLAVLTGIVGAAVGPSQVTLLAALCGVALSAAVIDVALARLLAIHSRRLSSWLRTGVRAITGVRGRAVVTFAAVATVAFLSAAAITSWESLMRAAIEVYQPATPEGAILIIVDRALTAPETEAVANTLDETSVPLAFQNAIVEIDGSSTFVYARSQELECVVERGLIGFGAIHDVTPCVEHTDHSSADFIDPLGIVYSGDPMLLTGRPGRNTASAAIVGGITSSPHHQAVQPVALDFSAETIEIVDVGPSMPALAAPAEPYSRLPAAFITPEQATQSGIEGDGSHTYLFIGPHSEGSEKAAREALPPDVRINAAIAVELGSPEARLRIPVMVSLILLTLLTEAVLVGAVTAIWNSDLRDDYLMLGAIGVPVWWRRKSSRGLALLLALPPVCMGTVWGVLAATGGVHALYGVRLSYPLGAILSAVVVPLAAATVIGHILAPTGARALRRG